MKQFVVTILGAIIGVSIGMYANKVYENYVNSQVTEQEERMIKELDDFYMKKKIKRITTTLGIPDMNGRFTYFDDKLILVSKFGEVHEYVVALNMKNQSPIEVLVIQGDKLIKYRPGMWLEYVNDLYDKSLSKPAPVIDPSLNFNFMPINDSFIIDATSAVHNESINDSTPIR